MHNEVKKELLEFVVVNVIVVIVVVIVIVVVKTGENLPSEGAGDAAAARREDILSAATVVSPWNASAYPVSAAKPPSAANLASAAKPPSADLGRGGEANTSDRSPTEEKKVWCCCCC